MNRPTISSRLTCWYYRRQSIPYIEESLAPAQRSAMSQHLTFCTDCREEVRSLQQVMTSVRRSSPPAPVVDPDLWSKLEGKIRVRRPSPGRSISWGLPAASLAALLIGLGGYLSMPRSTSSSNPSSAPTSSQLAMLPPSQVSSRTMAMVPRAGVQPHAFTTSGAASEHSSAPKTSPVDATRSLRSLPAESFAPSIGAAAVRLHRHALLPVPREVPPVVQAPAAFADFTQPSVDEPVFTPSDRLSDLAARRPVVLETAPPVPQSTLREVRGAFDEQHRRLGRRSGAETSTMVAALPAEDRDGALETLTSGVNLRSRPGHDAAAVLADESAIRHYHFARVHSRPSDARKVLSMDRNLALPALRLEKHKPLMTLAALSPDVLEAVNGVVSAGDEMQALRRNSSASPGVDWRAADRTSGPSDFGLTREDVLLNQQATPEVAALHEGLSFRERTVDSLSSDAFFSQVQTLDPLGRPRVTSQIVGEADPAGTVKFLAGESLLSDGDRP